MKKWKDKVKEMKKLEETIFLLNEIINDLEDRLDYLEVRHKIINNREGWLR